MSLAAAALDRHLPAILLCRLSVSQQSWQTPKPGKEHDLRRGMEAMEESRLRCILYHIVLLYYCILYIIVPYCILHYWLSASCTTALGCCRWVQIKAWRAQCGNLKTNCGGFFSAVRTWDCKQLQGLDWWFPPHRDVLGLGHGLCFPWDLGRSFIYLST